LNEHQYITCTASRIGSISVSRKCHAVSY
jgi:hypothetical protein